MNLIKNIIKNISVIQNQYSFGENINIYIIETQDEIILFDIPNYSEELKFIFEKYDKPIIGLLSHGPSGTQDGIQWQNTLNIKFYLHQADKDSIWLKMKPDILFEKISLSEEIEIINTPGHTKGCICLFHKETKTLFTGDSILYQNHKFEIEANKESIKTILKYNFKNILPLHYDLILGNAKLLLLESIR